MTTEIDQATATIAQLESKRTHLIQKAVELADERQKISFAAHAEKNSKARDRLDAINTATSVHASEMSSIESAIKEAQARLATAQTAAARAADRENAVQLLAKAAKLKELGDQMADVAWDFTTTTAELIRLTNEIHLLGTGPTAQLVRINVVTCVKSMLQTLPSPWISDFEFARLSPGQKKDFKSLCATWCEQIERAANARLGDEKQKAVA